MNILERMRAIGNNSSARNINNRAPPLSCRQTISLTANGFSNNYAIQQDKSVPSSDRSQQAWKPPKMVVPSVQEEYNDKNVCDLGVMATDASLYTIKENKNGKMEHHAALRLPSRLPRNTSSTSQSPNTFNILMVDVSASMSCYWNEVQNGWNNKVAPGLIGRTVIYTFGTSVTFRRDGVHLDKTDFDAGGTDLTGALQTIVNEVNLCTEKEVNIFIITDGDHNVTDVAPSTVISQMEAPRDKICSVYILGVGDSFPVQYSLDIRSRLHNGSSNTPSLFWSKQGKDIEREMINIGDSILEGSCVTVKIGVAGFSLPGLSYLEKFIFHSGEWVYFDGDPDALKQLSISFRNCTGLLELEPQDTTFEILDDIFRQWNSIIIQRNNKKEDVPHDILEFMEKVFMTQLHIVRTAPSNSISQRLQNKELKEKETQFKIRMRKLKDTLTTERFEDQLELAENVLSTTVTKEKFQKKYLRLKGHTDEEFVIYCSEFKTVYTQHKEHINSLSVTPEDCCRITMTSTVSDLQDPDFLKLLEDTSKFEFLKEFTMTGIPVVAPMRNSTTLNPWTFVVRSMLKSPYTIMSQVAMESFAQLQATKGKDKIIQLKTDDESTCYNAIVPVFPPAIAKTMKPVINTRLYAMCATFSIIKNPHIVDYNIHMASLAVTWLRCLSENPHHPRPEHIKIRMESIEATAELYLDQTRFDKYIRVLLSTPSQALMTESTEMYDSKPIKCESLCKPLFFLYMINKYKLRLFPSKVKQIIRLMLIEYIGRCLSDYKSANGRSTPYTDFFAVSLANQKTKKKWVKKFVSDAKAQISGKERMLLEDFYTFEKVTKAAKTIAWEQVENQREQMLTHIPLQIDTTKVQQLHCISAAGDVSWSILQAYAKEIGLSDEDTDQLFCKKSILIYTAHALQYRSSKDRLSASVKDYSSSQEFVAKKVQEESSQDVFKLFCNELVESLKKSWLDAYLEVHRELVKPMTRQEILNEAQRRGIDVTEATFNTVYKKYRPNTGLLGNACQIRGCPHFLIPNKSFNQHTAVERRESGHFVHGFHRIAYHFRHKETDIARNSLEVARVVRTPSTWSKVELDFKRLQRIYNEISH